MYACHFVPSTAERRRPDPAVPLALLLVAGQLPFGLSDIREVTFPQVDVQDFHEAPLKQLQGREHKMQELEQRHKHTVTCA